MKIIDLKCPNCSGNLKKDGDNYICNSCGGVFAVDYDESDVEYERLQTEAEREERRLAHEKELLEKKYELQQKANIESENRQYKREKARKRSESVKNAASSFVALVFVGAIICGGVLLFFFLKGMGSNGGSPFSEHTIATPTPAPNYNVTADDLKDQMNDFIEAGRIAQMNIDKCAYLDNVIKNYEKTDAVFLDAYLVTDIPETRPDRSNRLVLIYQVTWHNDDRGDQICYDGVYFEGIRVNPNGGIISNFSAETIWRSDAAWGWGMAYSFEDLDQCYRENVTALGGRITPITIENG